MEIILGCIGLAVFCLVATIAESTPNVATKKLSRTISSSNFRKRFKSQKLTSNRVWDTDRNKSNSSELTQKQ